MAYAIANGDFIECQFVYQYNGQTFRNVFHFRKSTGPSISDGASFLQSLISYLDVTWWDNLRANLSTELTLRYITAQVVNPFRYRLEKAPPTNATGSLSVEATPPSSTVNVQRWAQRSGRKYQGRIYIPGLPRDAQLLGVLKPDPLDALSTFAALIVLPITIAGSQLDQYLNTTGTDVLLQQVIGTAVDPVLRSQRRREIGKGE